MSKSYVQMADDILGGALTDTAKNPYDATTGHQADEPAMDPEDTLLEMTDAQRSLLMEGVVGSAPEPFTKKQAPTSTLELTAQDLEILSEAKRIIEKIQEATTVGSIGVNMAGANPLYPAKAVKIPGDRNVKPKKRTKKKVKTDVIAQDFLNYIKS